MNANYNLVIKDIAFMISNLQNDALYAATCMHLLNTDPATLQKMDDTNSTIIIQYGLGTGHQGPSHTTHHADV